MGKTPMVKYVMETLLGRDSAMGLSYSDGIQTEGDISIRGNLAQARFEWDGAMYTVILVEENIV